MDPIESLFEKHEVEVVIYVNSSLGEYVQDLCDTNVVLYDSAMYYFQKYFKYVTH